MDKENSNNPWISPQDLVGQLEPGDLIEFRRCALSGTELYKHWGIYMGFQNGIHEIGHVTNVDKIDEKPESSKKRNSFGFIFERKKASVRIDNLFDICSNGGCRINNSWDSFNSPLPKDEILSNIRANLGDYEYSLLFNNCEHFAFWARYNKEYSEQATAGLLALIFVFTPVAVPLWFFCHFIDWNF